MLSKKSLSRDNKRITASASADARPTQSNGIRSRFVLMESIVRIHDFKEFEFEGRSLPMVFTERGWTGILEATGNVYWDIVREFYTQLVNVPSNRTSWSVFVRGVRLTITPHKIASFLHLPRPVEDTKTVPPVDALQRALTGRDVVHHNNVICHNDLIPFFQKLHLIVASNVNPRQHTTDLSIEQGYFLLHIARGVCINLPNHIFQIIWSAAKSTSPKDALPFGLLITNLLLDEGVKPRSDEKSHKPRRLILLTQLVSQTDVQEREYLRAEEEEDVADQTPFQTEPAAKPSTQEAGSSSSQKTLPLWFDTLLLEIDSRVAAHIAPIQRQLEGAAALIAPIQRQLEGVDSRLMIMEKRLRKLQRIREE